MKHVLITIIGLTTLTSCTYRPHEKRLTNFGKTDGYISHSFYRKSNDTIEFKRILTTSSALVVLTGQIFLGDYALTHQKFIDKQVIKNNNTLLDSIRNSIEKNGFVKQLTDDRDVIFIQIVPDSSMGNFDALRFLNLRQEIEEKIDHRLKMHNLGEWFAGDMGAGGNMLFFVDNWDNANEEVMKLLKEEDLVDHVLIAKRIMASADDWNYEVVYPTDYEGVFNQM